jgi:hypothetical protein
MSLRLRQIALVARDLRAARADIEAVFGVDYAYADTGVAKYGLENAVFPLGASFLEVVSPLAKRTTAGRLLDKRGGDGGYMVILQTDRLIEARQRVHAAGARIVDQMDGDGVAFTHIHPRDVGGAILSIDAMEPKNRWDWGGPEWRDHRHRSHVRAIVAATLQADAPDQMAARWAEVLGCPVERGDGGWRIALDEGEIGFVGLQDGRGEGLWAIDVQTSDAQAARSAAERRSLLGTDHTIVVAGVHVRLIPVERGDAPVHRAAPDHRIEARASPTEAIK